MEAFDLEKELLDKDKRKLFYSLFRCMGKDYYFSHALKKIDTYQKDRILELISQDFPEYFDKRENFLLDKRFFALATANNVFNILSYKTDLFQEKDIEIELEGQKLIITKKHFDFSCKERNLTLEKTAMLDLLKEKNNLLKEPIKALIQRGVIHPLPFSKTLILALPSLLKEHHKDITPKEIQDTIKGLEELHSLITFKKIDNLTLSQNTINEIKELYPHNFIEKIRERKMEIHHEILKEYKEYFPYLDEIIEWIVACRFTYNRRSSFLHIRANAGFGKSFFKNLFAYINLLTECRYEDFKSPSSLDINHFNDKLVMIIDEFTVFKKEFKDLTNTILLDAKYQLRQETEVFAKIFLSAEKSNSFENGADSQIKDRINVIDINNTTKLEHLPLFKKYSSSMYMENVGYYVYHKIIELFDSYIIKGRSDSGIEAEKIMKNFYAKNALQTEVLDDVIIKHFIRQIHSILLEHEINLSKEEKEIKSKLFLEEEGVYIKQPKNTFEKIIKLGDETFYKKARYKIESIEKIFNQEIKNRKLNGKSIHCFFIPKEHFDAIFNEEKEGFEAIYRKEL